MKQASIYKAKCLANLKSFPRVQQSRKEVHSEDNMLSSSSLPPVLTGLLIIPVINEYVFGISG